MEKLQKVFLHNQRVEKFQQKVDKNGEKFQKIQLKLHNELVKQRIKNKGKATYDNSIVSKFAKSKDEKEFLMNGAKQFYMNDVSPSDLENSHKMVKKYSNFSKKIEFDNYKIDIEYVNNVGYKQKLSNFCFPSISINTKCKHKDHIKYFQHMTISYNSAKDLDDVLEHIKKFCKVYIVHINKSRCEITCVCVNDINDTPYVCKDNVFVNCPFWNELCGVKCVHICTCVVDKQEIITCIEWGFDNDDKALIPVAKQPFQNTDKAYIIQCQNMLNDILSNVCN
jgi:hypothetical protein